MRAASHSRAKFLAPLIWLICAPPAFAKDGPFKQVRGWSIYRNETNCSAYMLFDNDEAVGFTYDAPGRSTRVTFSDAHATYLEEGDSPSFDILLRHPDGTVDHTWQTTLFTVSVDEDGRRMLTSRWLGPPALEDFRSAAFIGFFDGDTDMGVFSLEGTATALQEVMQCSITLRDLDR